MDELRLNRPVADPRPKGGRARFFLIAIAIAAGLHLLVFAALALSSQKPKPVNPPVATAVPVQSRATEATTQAPAASRPVPAALEVKAPPLTPAPVAPPAAASKAVRHVGRPRAEPAHIRAATRHERGAASAERPHKKIAPAQARKPAKAKPASKHPHGKAKPVPALDLDALSKFKSSGK